MTLASTRPGSTPAVSLWQPWATLTMTEDCSTVYPDAEALLAALDQPPRMLKRYETRPHRAPSTIIGRRVLIHAAQRLLDVEHMRAIGFGERHSIHFRGTPRDRWTLGDLEFDMWTGFPYGALVGSAVIGEPLPIRDDCSTVRHVCRIAGQLTHHEDLVCGAESDTEFDIHDQEPFGDWTPGRWAWPLLDPRPLAEPIPWKGKQGVFYVPDKEWCDAADTES